MTVIDKELVESFSLEIIANSKKISRDCLKVSTYNFPSKASIKIIQILSILATFIEESTKSVYKEIDWDVPNQMKSSFVMLRNFKSLVQQLSADLQYIENSKMSKVPSGLSSPLQNIAQNIETNVEILLLQQWVYNYSINTNNRIHRYKAISQKLSPYISDELNEKIEPYLENPIYSISFPSLEKNNILLYSVLGHEIGHLVADKNHDEFKTQFFGTNNIQSALFNFYTNNSSLYKSRSHFLEIINFIEKRLYDELLSDVVGAIIFGPAMLFSMYEFSQQFDIDTTPENKNNFYPPWRARLRIIYNTIIKFIPSFQTYRNISSEHLYFDINLLNRLIKIEEIINKTSDLERMEAEDNLTFIIYTQVTTIINNSLLNKLLIDLDRNNFNEDEFFDRINKLSIRLKHCIPPNTTNDLDINSNADLYEIINSAWKNRLSWEPKIFDNDGNFNEKYLHERKKLNKLTLKAIEYANLTKEYNNFISGVQD